MNTFHFLWLSVHSWSDFFSGARIKVFYFLYGLKHKISLDDVGECFLFAFFAEAIRIYTARTKLALLLCKVLSKLLITPKLSIEFRNMNCFRKSTIVLKIFKLYFVPFIQNSNACEELFKLESVLKYIVSKHLSKILVKRQV